MKGLYKSGLNRILDGQIDVELDTINITLIRTDRYDVSLENDTFLAAIPREARVQTLRLIGVEVKGGGVYAEDIKFTDVGEWGHPTEGELVIWMDEDGDETRSPLIAYLGKSGDQIGFGVNFDPYPLRLIGGDISIIWGDEPVIYLWTEDEEE